MPIIFLSDESGGLSASFIFFPRHHQNSSNPVKYCPDGMIYTYRLMVIIGYQDHIRCDRLSAPARRFLRPGYRQYGITLPLIVVATLKSSQAIILIQDPTRIFKPHAYLIRPRKS